jgi:hypothetical protein
MKLKHSDDSAITDDEVDEASDAEVSEDSQSDDDDISADPAENIEKGYKNPFWRFLLEHSYEIMEDFPENIEELKSFEYFNDFVDKLRKHYNLLKHLILSLQNSDIEDKLSEYEESLEEKNFSEEDAQELAWDHLKFLFKRLIDHNKDIFAKELDKRE